jgi:hypothetical protein
MIYRLKKEQAITTLSGFSLYQKYTTASISRLSILIDVAAKSLILQNISSLIIERRFYMGIRCCHGD